MGATSDDPASAKPSTDSALMMVRRSVGLTGLQPATLDPQRWRLVVGHAWRCVPVVRSTMPADGSSQPLVAI